MDELLPAAFNPMSAPAAAAAPVVAPVAAILRPPPFWVTEWFPHWASETLFGFAIWQWVGLLAAIFIGLVLKTLTRFVTRLLKKITLRYNDQIQHQVLVAIEKPLSLLVATGFWYLSIYHLQFTGEAQKVLKVITSVLFGISVIWAVYRMVDVLSYRLQKLAEKTETDLDDSLVPLFTRSLRIFVVVLGALILVQNLGFNVMSLIAGLGLGGLAFALAAQDTAANLFGSLMILTDRPFKVGDLIETSEGEGFVEDVGFRSTRIRTRYDSLVTIPNSKMATMKIDNMGQRYYRRIKETITLTYDATPAQIEAFVEGLKQMVMNHPDTHKEKGRYNAVLFSFNSSSIDILFFCFIRLDDWDLELQTKQGILLEIMHLTKKVGVEFAFPTQTLHVASLPADSNADLSR